MKKNIIKIQSILKELYQINDELGGKNIRGDFNSANLEFDELLTYFRERIFSIKSAQKERDFKKQKQGMVSVDMIRLNQQIRTDIKQATQMLVAAEKLIKKIAKKPQTTEQQKQNMKKKQLNSIQLLRDVKQIEEGGTYEPPKPTTTLKQLLGGRLEQVDQDNQLNIDEYQAFDEFKNNDKEMDTHLEQIIEGNERVQRNAKQTGEMIDQSQQKIRKATKIVDRVNVQVIKANTDLAEVLLNYRRPSKLCLDITLVVLLLGLIGVVINMIKTNSS